MVPFKVESWLWYSVVMVVVIFRFISRVLHFKSVLRFQLEDYLMMFLACNYTTFIVLINICVHTNTNLIDPADIPNLTPQDVAERTYGSKVNVAVEQTMCMTQWGTKVCLLLLYYRLTENLVQNTFVKAVGAFVAASFLVMEALYFGYWCRPFSDYWETPTANVQCTTALHHLTVNISFNLTSDIMIMSIPLPLLLRARLEIKRKILLCFPFTLGFFSIICAILSKYVSFTHPFSPVWVFWYTREASCVMIVANMPYTWGLVRRVFNLQSFWGRGSSAPIGDSGEIRDTPDTAMEIIAGEVRQIPAVEVHVEEHLADVEKAGLSSRWKHVSTIFGGEKSTKSTPQISVVTTTCSEKSQTVMQSQELAADEQWKNVDWVKHASQSQVTQVNSPSETSPNSLMAPSPAVIASTRRDSSHPESRRTSMMSIQRLATHNSRRSRLSTSDLSRRNTRHSLNVDALDRLYRLDDEGLVADLEASSRPHSRQGGFD